MKKYIIFDMDGTLIKSEGINTQLEYECLKTYIPDLELDYFKYYTHQTGGTPLFEQLKVLFKNSITENELKRITNELYSITAQNRNKSFFFEWVIEMVKNLQKDYTLFLSTGNSDEYAQKKMSDGWIGICFHHIIGSSIILKWFEHIKIFKEITGDEDFEKHAVYIGDGNTDREIAQANNIDFIKVWKTGIDTYEVNKTIEILPILKKLS